MANGNVVQRGDSRVPLRELRLDSVDVIEWLTQKKSGSVGMNVERVQDRATIVDKGISSRIDTAVRMCDTIKCEEATRQHGHTRRLNSVFVMSQCVQWKERTKTHI